MIKILVCPFGHYNLMLTLFELLNEKFPDKYLISFVSFSEYGKQILKKLDYCYYHIPPGEQDSYFDEKELDCITKFSRRIAEINENNSYEKELKKAANHYGNNLNKILESDNYNTVTLFNGRMNLFVTVLDHLADKRNLNKLVFEQGLFRPDYLTVDGKGVNFINSVNSLDDLLQGRKYAYQKTELFKDLNSLLPVDKNKINDYKRVAPITGLASAYIKTRFKPGKYIFLRTAEGRDLLESSILNNRKAPQTDILHKLLNSKEYKYVILCPMQVETDTQVVLYSPLIGNMAELVEHVSRSVDKYNAVNNEKACVIFKKHPMHKVNLELKSKDAFFINESTISEIIDKRCDLIITINSTVGIEGIQAGLPVITLGKAFYNFSGVISDNCKNLTELPELIQKALHENTIDKDLQKSFIKALKDNYQVRLH